MNAESKTSMTIREIAPGRELRDVEGLQKEIWGVPDLDVVPVTHLVAVQEAGGVLLGAFDGETMVGFVYGFVGIERGRMVHHSHMLAVKPAYRNFDLGRKLKMAQRQRVIDQGINLMTWTFDPLQSLNAYFNFSKLGVFSDRYLINFYGEEAASFLHQTGTDRLLVTWDLTKNPAEGSVDEICFKENFGHITPLVKVADEEFPLAGDLEEGLYGQTALIEIPANINDLVKRDRQSALKWREATRRAFTGAIKEGFRVEAFFRMDRGGRKQGVYLLGRGEN
ncbi:MAG: GNAT family N-acetyltransferase [Pyrinomonadaceae bacterium]